MKSGLIVKAKWRSIEASYYVNKPIRHGQLRLFSAGVNTPSVLVKFHSPDGSGCRFVHSAASGVVLKLNGYHR